MADSNIINEVVSEGVQGFAEALVKSLKKHGIAVPTDDVEKSKVMQEAGYVHDCLKAKSFEKRPHGLGAIYKCKICNKDWPNLHSEGKKKLILQNPHSPGDIIVMTAALRDLHATYPGEYLTDVDSPCAEIFEGNPYITRLDKKDADVAYFKAEYPLIHQSNEGPYHFIHGYRKHLAEAIGRPIKAGTFKGDIHIRDEEKHWINAVQTITGDDRPFWIIDAGYKQDFTAKAWDFRKYQAVIDYFKDKIQFVQVGHKDHIHPDLDGVINMVGCTDLRQLIRLFYWSIGVLTPVSMPMVLAAAVPCPVIDAKYTHKHVGGKIKQRACVVIAGSREPVQWQEYPFHQFIHNIGCMTCCDNGACWKSRVVPDTKTPKDDKNQSLCMYPVHLDNGQDVGKCMDIITAIMVIKAIEKWYMPEVGVFVYDTRKTISIKYKEKTEPVKCADDCKHKEEK
jgi:hypothetical protein